jgi:hypothetical protein
MSAPEVTETAAPIPLATFTAKGHRVGKRVDPIEITVKHLENVSIVFAAECNFRPHGHYFVNGRVVAVRFAGTNGKGVFKKSGIVFEYLYASVRGAHRVIEKTAYAALIEMEPCETVDVFYEDGRVAQITVPALAIIDEVPIQLTFLPPKDALDKRLALVVDSFGKALEMKDDTDDERNVQIRRLDKQFHELANLLRLTALFPDLRKEVTRVIGYLKKQMKYDLPFNEGVMVHFKTVLRAIGDDNKYWWLGSGNDTDVSKLLKSEVRMLPRLSPLSRLEKTKTPEERRKDRLEYEKRRDARRSELRSAQPAKGAGGTADPRGSKGKGKK